MFQFFFQNVSRILELDDTVHYFLQASIGSVFLIEFFSVFVHLSAGEAMITSLRIDQKIGNSLYEGARMFVFFLVDIFSPV